MHDKCQWLATWIALALEGKLLEYTKISSAFEHQLLPNLKPHLILTMEC